MIRVLAERRRLAIGASLLMTVAPLGCGAVPPSSVRLGDGRDPATYGFELGALPEDPGFVASGMARDQLHTLVDPPHFPAAEVPERNEASRGKVLVSSDRVVGLVVGGEARAWPLNVLRWHEVVNDTLGGVPVLIAYSPLCDAVVAAERTLDGEVLTFGSSGLLLDSDPLLFDRRDDPAASSLWRQLGAEAVAGPLEGSRLRLLAPALATWAEWSAAHPETTVLDRDPALKRAYKRDPYHSYFGSDLLHFPVDPLPPPTSELHLKDRVVILDAGDQPLVLPLADLAELTGADEGVIDIKLDGRPLRLHFALAPGTAWLEPPGVQLDGVSLRTAFWFAWYAAHGDDRQP